MKRMLFVDQSGQLGGAELCLADVVAPGAFPGEVLLLSDGPFVGHLRRRGVSVEVLALPAALAGVGKAASVADLLAAGPEAAAYLLRLRRKMRGFDAFYFNTMKALLYGVAAGTGLGRPAVFHLHDILDGSHFSRAAIRLIVAAANRVDVVIANSRATAEAFAAAGGRTRVEVIPNGFDPRIQASPGEAARVRGELGAGDRCVAAIFGRLARWKGQHVLIEAAALRPNLEVWIVGDALFTSDDRDYAEGLRRQAAEAKVADRVRFLGFRDDVPALMRATDVVVSCSTAAEPFGRVLVEAMRAGRPVIATALGGPLEIVDPGKTGLLVPPSDKIRLAEALALLEESPTKRNEMGKNGRTRADNLFSLAFTNALTAGVIRSLLSEEAAR
jgi:glycosyltransferase involved in cell wall biosynthesis